MKIDVTFSEISREFTPEFGEIHNVSDGGFERGYAAGYEEGVNSVPDYLAELINGNLIEYNSNIPTRVSEYAFQNNKRIKTVGLPNAVTIGVGAFASCTSLVNVNVPSATTFDNYAFQHDAAIAEIDLPSANNIKSYVFHNCTALSALILRADSVCTLASATSLQNTPIEKGTGYIYVPDNLVEQYKAATNWSTYANQIRAIEDYPEITGG